MSKNAELNTAGRSKMDEFYTSYDDVAAELHYYRSTLAGKTVLCNCDDPVESNFVLFFLNNFHNLGLERVIATCCEDPALGRSTWVGGFPVPASYSRGGAYYASVTEVPDDFESSRDYRELFGMTGNELRRLAGNGDFRSPECADAINEADVLVTNPPFSLFRDYLRLATGKKKSFLIIGNVNALTYKDVFPLFRDRKLWLGSSIHSGDRAFYVPDSYPLDAAGCGIDALGRRYVRVKGVRWFTNLASDGGFKHLALTRAYNPDAYPIFDNYNAINVNRTSSIPCDYPGFMGVPITFLDKYCPDQFEILMLANGNARTNTDPAVLRAVGYRRHPRDKGGVGMVKGKRTYARVLIRNRNPKAMRA